jgi:hypothetical protein
MTNPIPVPTANSQARKANSANRSTGPRTAAGKQRSSQNAVTHGLTKPADPDGTFPGTEVQERSKGVPATSQSHVLATEDPVAYQQHCRQFLDEYQPATPTETQLTQQLADTAWRLNRVPILEAALLDRAANPPSERARIEFDIVDAHRALATLGVHSQRLACQFRKTLDQLREIQAERRLQQERDLKRAAALLELHKHKGLPYYPGQYGFVFSKDQIEAFSQRLIRLNQSRHIEHVLFHMQPPIQREAARAADASYQPGSGS